MPEKPFRQEMWADQVPTTDQESDIPETKGVLELKAMLEEKIADARDTAEIITRAGAQKKPNGEHQFIAPRKSKTEYRIIKGRTDRTDLKEEV